MHQFELFSASYSTHGEMHFPRAKSIAIHHISSSIKCNHLHLSPNPWNDIGHSGHVRKHKGGQYHPGGHFWRPLHGGSSGESTLGKSPDHMSMVVEIFCPICSQLFSRLNTTTRAAEEITNERSLRLSFSPSTLEEELLAAWKPDILEHWTASGTSIWLNKSYADRKGGFLIRRRQCILPPLKREVFLLLLREIVQQKECVKAVATGGKFAT